MQSKYYSVKYKFAEHERLLHFYTCLIVTVEILGETHKNEYIYW